MHSYTVPQLFECVWLFGEGKILEAPQTIVLNTFQDAEGQPVIIGVSAWGIHIFHNNRLINKFVW